MNFDPKNFRRALGKFATGVTVVTTLDSQQQRVGVTASSFNSVSIDPPLVLWSVDKSAYSAEAFRNAPHFAINVLANDQVDISNRFARRGEDKFEGVACSEGIGKVPRIGGAVACFECRTWNVYEGGDHHIIVGEVLDFHYDENRNSLVFHNGRYAVPEQHPVTKPVDESRALEGALGDSLIYLLRQAYSACCEGLYPKLGHYGVNAEEWRVLTLLGDRGALKTDDIAAVVMQPPQELRDTLVWLREKGLVHVNDDQVVGLTDAGDKLSHRLLDMASDCETGALGALSADQAALIKQWLRDIARAGRTSPGTTSC